MKFKSIRSKLITKVSWIFIISFTIVLSLVAYLNLSASEENLAKSEESIRSSLIAKGSTLVKNNSQALRGMVEDNGFSAVQEVVANTVESDSDIVYGVYMTPERQPWVFATEENPEGTITPGEALEGENHEWASQLEAFEFKTFDWQGYEVYEFVAPVGYEDDILGYLRYGFTTKTMKQQLKEESEASRQALITTIAILLGVGILAVLGGFNATRNMAIKISKPLNELTSAAENIASGDYNNEVNVRTDDEVGVLAENFETMRATINKKMKDLATLNETGEVLASLLDQNRALEEALKTMHDHCGVSQGSVFLMNDKNELEVKGFFPPKVIDNEVIPAKFKLGEGVIGSAAEAKKIVFVPNTAEDTTFLKGETTENPRALLCIPLLDKDVLIGVMNFSGEVGAVTFEDSDYEFASSIARLLVITIKNIRMREVIEEQNRTLELKVKERTAELQVKTNDILNMMQNMHQGLFTVMEGGVVHHEYAAYLEEILETKKIAKRNFMDLLFNQSNLGSDRLDQVSTAVESLLGSDEMMFEFNSHLLPTEYNILNDDKSVHKVVELDWDPIVFDGEIDKIMVTVRDVTELKALQAAAESQKQELEIIGHILSVDTNKFNEFISTSYQFIDECRSLIESKDEKDPDVVATLFRNMHTVKGNARTFGFSYITNSVHEVETTYDELRKNEDKEWNKEELLEELLLAENDVKRYETVSQEKLGRGSGDSDSDSGMASIDRKKLNSILESMHQVDTSSLNDDIKQCFKSAYQMLLDFEAKTIDKVLSEVIESAGSIAQEMSKPVPEVVIHGDKAFIKMDAHNMLNNIFMHVFRNAVDHGIEGPDERKSKGKTEQGKIELTVNAKNDHLEFVVKDDGKGLALKKIYEKAIENKIFNESDNPAPEEVANLIFSSGLSTAEEVTAVSGRGVGMDAVKQFLEKEGGGIEVVLDDGEEGADFRTFSTVIRIPEKYYYVVSDELAMS
ncbi:HAMP domain-containing protein [Pleionea sediminis]|uniref:HAMP domain-containing protein n=1 Tax=Pleionea sediminis TaxID=2569479 RepID=UPI001184B666|nr:HAMP domain-containing protein [Pleionea sediminis]